MRDPILMANAEIKIAIGHLGKIASLKHRPPDNKTVAYTKETMLLNYDGIQVLKPKPFALKALVIPNYITDANRQHEMAFTIFPAFMPCHKKKQVLGIDETKTEVTKHK